MENHGNPSERAVKCGFSLWSWAKYRFWPWTAGRGLWSRRHSRLQRLLVDFGAGGASGAGGALVKTRLRLRFHQEDHHKFLLSDPIRTCKSHKSYSAERRCEHLTIFLNIIAYWWCWNILKYHHMGHVSQSQIAKMPKCDLVCNCYDMLWPRQEAD